jgi:hypothetical protein
LWVCYLGTCAHRHVGFQTALPAPMQDGLQ